MFLPLPIVYFTEVDRTKAGPVKASALAEAESTFPINALQLHSEFNAIAARASGVSRI